MSDECCVVLVTVGSRDEADEIASTLVQERLAACCNVAPGLVSIYRWKGNLTRDEETLLIVKTRRPLFESLRARIAELHSYETPEIVALPIAAGHGPYLDWVRQETDA